jgi:chromosome segregation ATPase
MHKTLVGACLVCLGLGMALPGFSQEEVELENQLRRAKKDIEQLEKERAKVRQATLDDYQQFKDYQQHARQQYGTLKRKNDSLNQIASKLRMRNSVLGSNINGIKSRQREYDLNQEKTRARLELLCDTLLQVAEVMSPLLSEKQGTSIKFLKSEIHAATSDNLESMSRLYSILTDLENRVMDIEVDQGDSPVPGITGVVYRLRIGGIHESVVNEAGTQSALWNFETRQWDLAGDKDTSARIRKAIAIRAGKSVPELVTLPVSLKAE